MKLNLPSNTFKIKQSDRNNVRQVAYNNARSKTVSNPVLDHIKSELDYMIGMEMDGDHKSPRRGTLGIKIGNIQIKPLHNVTKLIRIHSVFESLREAMKKELIDSIDMAVHLESRYITVSLYSYNGLLDFYYNRRTSSMGNRLTPRRFLHAAIGALDKDEVANLFK